MLKNIKLQRISFLSAILSILVILVACNGVDSGNIGPFVSKFERVPLSSMALAQPADCATFKSYVSSSLVKRYTHIPQYPYYACGTNSGGGLPVVTTPTDGTTAAPAPSTGSGANAPSGPDGVSQTNNQENGVNESDMVKVNSADGTLFIGHGSHLIIAKAFPPQNMEKLKEIDLGGLVINLFYDETNQRLIVMTRYNTPIYILASNPPPLVGAPIDNIMAPSPIDPETIVTIFNVSNPAEPGLIDQLSIQGYYQDSRRIDNRLHLVTRFDQDPVKLYLDPEFNQLKTDFDTVVYNVGCTDPSGFDPTKAENDPAVIAAKAKLSTKIETVVAATDITAFLPSAKRGDASNQTDIAPYLQCTDVYFPKIEANLGMQVVTSMDTDGSNVEASAVVNNAWLTYVSPTHLYMAERSNNWFWDKPNIDQTAIYKFSISQSKPQYLATGSVDGYANNAFSFSEHNDVLRVATTQTVYENMDDPTIGFWRPIFKNHLTILQDDNNGKMNTISEIRDIAVGETIRGVRFLANRGFIVTFRNKDPLFTFDLTNPYNPELKGELTIPGFSSYLHPYDDNHLLTIGPGEGNDVQLQLFDVSDLSKPAVIHKFTPNLPQGYSWSEAQYDHHAFTYYAPANLLAIPIQISPYSNSSTPFSGVIAFKVTLDNGFEELGRVDHADLAKQYYCVDNTVVDSLIGYCNTGYYGNWATPRRSVVMTSGPSVYLYTISDVGLKANEIGDFSTILGSLLFPPQIYPWYVGGIGVDTGIGGGAVAAPVNITDTL